MARGRRGRGGIEIEVELIGRRKDEMESCLGEVGVGGGARDAAARGRCSTAAHLVGEGQVLAEHGGMVVRGLFQLEQRQGGKREGGGRAFTQDLPIDIEQGVQLGLDGLDL